MSVIGDFQNAGPAQPASSTIRPASACRVQTDLSCMLFAYSCSPWRLMRGSSSAGLLRPRAGIEVLVLMMRSARLVGMRDDHFRSVPKPLQTKGRLCQRNCAPSRIHSGESGTRYPVKADAIEAALGLAESRHFAANRMHAERRAHYSSKAGALVTCLCADADNKPHNETTTMGGWFERQWTWKGG